MEVIPDQQPNDTLCVASTIAHHLRLGVYFNNTSFDCERKMQFDPRQLAALQIQLDILADQAKATDDAALNAALDRAKEALGEAYNLLNIRGLFLQIPHDYKPPEGLDGSKNSKPK